MKRVQVTYNNAVSEFEIKVLDLDGVLVHRFNLHGIGMIELIKEIKREVADQVADHEKSMKPILTLIRGGDC